MDAPGSKRTEKTPFLSCLLKILTFEGTKYLIIHGAIELKFSIEELRAYCGVLELDNRYLVGGKYSGSKFTG